jgi:pseudolysin
LTIIAHEISHGFTQQHSHLQYLEQSGALNESFSDMASKAAEYYATGYNHDWQLAPEIMRENRAYRYMDNPRRDCINTGDKKHCSIDHVKDYSSDLNVHYTSGIFNKAFYLLATSPNWNTHMAFDVMVQANRGYWTQTTTFKEAACGVIEATKDYRYDTNTVDSVFAKVGIDTVSC